MKTGLLTFHEYNNYGAVLQTYATLQILKSLGADAEIINLRRRPQSIFLSYAYNNVANRNFYRFRNRFLQPVTKKIHDRKELKNLNSRYDCFMVGSDQVWRPSLTRYLALHYFLDFASDDSLKISYASSFGKSSWNESLGLTKEVKKLLERFDAISVREDSGVEICRNIFDLDAELVLDPTLLLDAKDYAVLGQKSNSDPPHNYAVTFFLDVESKPFEASIHKTMLNEISLPCISLSIPILPIPNVSYTYRPRKVAEWISFIRNSDFIITDSFHCMVFALIFQKRFVCIMNPRRGTSRPKSLLRMLGLTEHLIGKNTCDREKLRLLFNKEIDYGYVRRILDEKKNESVFFLKNALT